MYYMGIADGILQTGEMRNLATIPSSPVMTPQNGVVLVHLVLSFFGLVAENRLIAIIFINYLLHLSAIYPLYKIARRVGLNDTLPLAALLGLYTCAYNLYRYQLMPYNDGIFNSLSIWFAYLLLVFYDEKQSDLPQRNRILKFVPVLVLAILIVHFRLQALFLVGAGVLATFLARKFWTLPYNLILLALALGSLALPYLWVDTSGISQVGNNYVSSQVVFNSNFLFKIISKAQVWLNEIVPNVLATDLKFPLNLVYSAFVLAMGWALIKGLRQRQIGMLFISLTCLVSILGVIAFVAPLPRYLSYLFPFLYLLILLSIRMRLIGYIFIASVFALSLAKLRFVNDVPKPNHDGFWLYLYEKRISLDSKDPVFLSDEPGSTYLIFRVRSFVGELNWEQIMNHQSVFLCGSEASKSFYLTKIQHLVDTANFTFKTRDLTPDYQDEKGRKLLELYDFLPSKL